MTTEQTTRDCRIRITYSIVTPESAEQGDAAESRWENEDGVEIEPWDEEGTYVSEAVSFLNDKGACFPSSSQYHAGVWYSDEPEQDYITGHTTERSYHLSGFTPEEEAEIYKQITQ